MKKYFIALFLIIPTAAFGGMSDGFLPSNITPSAAFNLKTNGFVLEGAVYDFDLVWSGNSFEIQNPVVNSCFQKAPKDQWPNDRYAQTNYSIPPEGYTSVIGWVLAVNKDTAEGYVLLNSLKVYGKDPEGKIHLVSEKITCDTCTKPEDKVFGWHMPKSNWRDLSAWKVNPNNASAFEILNSGTIKIPTSNNPSDVYHLFNTEWPRSPTTFGWSYFVRAEIQAYGSGMVQIGLDFYKGEDISQAAISNWNCESINPVTITAGFQ